MNCSPRLGIRELPVLSCIVNSSKPKILVVDDELEILQAVKDLLERRGYQILTAPNGAEALSLARAQAPDLLLTDMMMPVMDGFTLCRQWKADPALQHIPIVCCTAVHTHDEDQQFVLALGAERVLAKPHQAATLIRTIEEVCQKRICAQMDDRFKNETEFLKRYNERLVQDLHRKVAELETSKRQLEDELTERVQMDQARRESEESLRAVLDSLTAHIAVLNPEGQIVRVNAAWEHFAEEYDRIAFHRAAVGENYLRVLQHSGNPVAHQAAEGIRAVLHGALPLFVLEYSCDVATDQRWYALLVTPKAGNPGGAVVSHVNITARKRVECALRESQQRFEQAMTASHIGLWDWDVPTDHIYISPLWKSQLGYDDHEITNEFKEWEQRLHPDDRTATLDRLHACLQNPNGHHELEFRLRHKDGSYRWILARASALLDEAGKPRRLIGINLDVTERKQADQQIREQARLLDLAQDAIIVCDVANRIRYWNQGAERLYGWKSTEALNQLVTTLMCSVEDALQQMRQSLEANGEWSGELHQVTRDGLKLTVDSRWTLLRDDQGKPKSILIINTDLTEKKKLEASFLRTQRLDSIGKVAAGISHDLNNILAPILMSATLLSQHVTHPRSQKLLATIESSTQRCADLVKQLLLFARGIEGEQMALDPRHLISEVIRMITATFPRSLDIQSRTSDDLGMVAGDPTQLHQVLLNLCVNARDAMPNGGKLVISAENFQVDASYAAMSDEVPVGSYVCLKVIDNGPGIPPEILDRIFEPFFTTKQQGQGTGLGLSTSLSIVKNHRGYLNVQTHLGKGTTFEVLLPVAPVQAGEPALAVVSAKPRGSGEMILVVDDEPLVAEAFKDTLEQNGYHALIAQDGTEALALFFENRQKIKAVITDLVMPHLDGVALIRSLKKVEPRCRIIASSGVAFGQGDQDRIDELRSLGVHTFLSKPYNAQKLLVTLAQVLSSDLQPAQAAA